MTGPAAPGLPAAPRSLRHRYGGCWQRGFALLADAALLLLLLYLVERPLYRFVIQNTLLDAGGDRLRDISALFAQVKFLLMLVFPILYAGVMEASELQATFGKRLFGLRVQDLGGRPLSWGRSFGRNAAKLLSVLVFLLGFVPAAFTARRQALHDLLAGTTVAKRRFPPSP